MSDRPIESLDDLFADAAATERKFPTVAPQRVMRNAKPEAPKVTFHEKYTLPEFWVAGKGVALVHEETKTLLGNFQEFFHKTERGAKRLVRVDEPIEVARTEYVSGKQWLGEERHLMFAPESWTTKREVILGDLALHCLGVHAEGVHVEVSLSGGGMVRCDLCFHTTFMSPDARSIITLTKGTNVLPAMSLDAKIELRKELAI